MVGFLRVVFSKLMVKLTVQWSDIQLLGRIVSIYEGL